MNRELNQSAKKFNFLEKLQINSYVDAIDESRWKVAQVVGFKNVGHRHSIKLHFDGFPTGWDEEFDLPASSKLAAFRRYTLPYTGPLEHQVIHRPAASLNFEEPVADLRKLTKQDKQKLKPDFIIQKFRGQLFILVDTLLTQSVKLKSDQYELILRFLEAYIQTGIHILKFSLQKMSDICKENINDPNVIYVNPIHALISSIPQILFNFNSLVSSKERRVKLYQYGDPQPEEARKKMKNFLKSKDIVAICRSILDFQQPPHRGFPWVIKKEALILLTGLDEPAEFKISDNREIPEALDVLGYLRAKQTFSEQTIEKIHIDLIIALILSGNFEGKLKGLAELKRLCQGMFSLKKQVLKQKILTPTLLNALTDNSTFNGQIFKRSLTLFQTAAKYDLLTDDVLKRISNLHKDKHQLELKSYYETLAEFGAFLGEKKVVPFFEEFKKISISIDTINLIKQYTLNVIKSHPVYKKKYMTDETGLGLVYLWQVIKQEKSPELVSHAIAAFSALAGDLFYRQVIQKYLIECFNNIKTGKNVENSLKIIHSCLNKNRQIVNIVENIDKQFNIIDILVKSLIQAESLSSKTIQSVFEFVEEVNQYARKKITVDHIRDLWHLKQCQNSLLKFMRKYSLVNKDKSHEKIIFKKLSTLEIREIFGKIFSNKALMDNYVDCDEQLYKTIDELLISYNHRNKGIQYNFKHCIRCIAPQELFGIDIFLDISLNCKDDAMVRRVITRFVQYYLRPYKSKLGSCKVDKVGLWLQCSDKLTKYLENSPQKYIGYTILFEQLRGRMKSINILDPSDAVFTVLAKQSNVRKTLTLAKNCSLWKLREVINQQFKFNNTNFEMYVTEKRSTTDMETQEDFSVVYLEVPKDPATVTVVVTQSRDPHPHYVMVEEFKANFSNIYAEKIYESFSSIKSFDIQILALDILLKIPTLKSLQSKIAKLQIGKQITWDQILDGECRPKLCYQISALNKVKSQGLPWITSFIKKGGVQHLQKILRQRSSSKVALNVKDYQILLQLLGFFNQTIQLYRIYQPTLPFNQSSVIEILKLSQKDKSNPQLLKEPIFLDYFYLAFTGLEEMVGHYALDGQKVLSSTSVVQVLQLLLFTERRTQIQSRFPNILLRVYQKSKCDRSLSQICSAFLSNLTSNPKQRYSCRVFFDLLVLIFDNNFVTNQLYILTLKFIEIIRNAPSEIYLQPENTTNELINGWLRICKCLLLKSITDNNNLKCIPEPQDKFADFLIKQGLFGEQHRFQSERCRLEAFQILTQLNSKKQIMENIGKEIVPIITRGTWRKQHEWFVKSFKKREKNSEVGLKNLAATCYINSLLQQLYHIKQFSQPLLQINSKQIQDKQNIAYQIQKIFAYLKYSNRQVYTTESLCDTFISDGQPIDPRIQMDVDQFFHTLMDKLEQNLMKIKKHNIIDDVFKGENSNLIVGLECQHKSERIQQFSSIGLEIIKKNSLKQALMEYIKGEVLEGENAYFCQKCNKKVKAMKRVCLKSLPNVLILKLKRFQFDFDRMEKFKLNSFCQFEQNLDMEPYMRESLYENQQKLPKEEYQYRLKGVVIHYGISEAGHYTSYIRIENGEWKYFDDDKISSFDFKDLGNQCFGGIDENPYSDNSEKIKNAYLLIYEKVSRKKVGKLSTNPAIKAEVDAENLNNQQIKILFQKSLQTFCDTHFLQLGKTYLLFVHLVSLRSEQRPLIMKKCYENCIKIFESNPPLIEWYLAQFSENLIKELLIFAISEVSYFVASLLAYSVGKFFSPEFIKVCMKCIDKKNMMPLCKVFQAASFNANYWKVLNQYSFLEKIYKIIKEDKAPNQGSLSKVQTPCSQFGEPFVEFTDKKDYKNSIELIQCIQLYKFKNLPKEDLQPFMKRAKKLSAQVYLAKFFASKLKDDESFTFLTYQFALHILTKFEPKIEEEYIHRFVIILLARICDPKDESSKARASAVAEIYLHAIKQSLDGYKLMRLLLSGLFSLCFNNDMVREEFINLISHKDNKKYIKLIRDWMKESDKFYSLVKIDKFGYWKRIGRSSYVQLERIQSDIKVAPDKYLSLFNSLLERHKIEFTDLYSPTIKKGERILLNQFAEEEYEVVDKFGLILHIKSEANERFIPEDDVFPLRSV